MKVNTKGSIQWHSRPHDAREGRETSGHGTVKESLKDPTTWRHQLM